MYVKSVAALMVDRPVARVRPGDTLETACDLMTSEHVGALPVMIGPQLVGILSERDIIRHASQSGGFATTPVSVVMTRDVQTVEPEASASEALTVMSEGGFRHLPVVNKEGIVVGMVSIRDIPTEIRLMRERFVRWSQATAAE